MIQVRITAEAQQVLAKLQAIPAAVRDSLRATLDKENELTIGYIQANRLSKRGPETLGVRTNRLRSSIRRANAKWVGDSLQSQIGTNVEYAAAHEFGFRGSVTVKAHTRTAPIRNRGAFGPRAKETLGEGRQIAVRAHTRNVNIPERAPIRRGIEARAGKYSARLSAAIVKAVGGAA